MLIGTYQSIRFSVLGPSFLLGVALFLPLPLHGAELPDPSLGQPGFFDPADAPRDYLSGKFVGFAGYIDRFFGDDRNYQESNKSLLQLDVTRLTGRGAERRFVLSGRAKLHLPRAEKRFHLLLETDPDKNVTGESAQPRATAIGQIAAPESYAAAARYENAKEQLWHFSADAGLRFQGVDTRPFVRARGSYVVPLEQWRVKATETLFWFNTTGAGESTQIDAERLISEPVLFRASTNARWLRDTQIIDLRQDLSVYEKLNERNALLYQVSVLAVSRPQWEVSEYVLLLNNRYRLHREWMYFEFGPQLHYPKAFNYRVTPYFGVRLEMLFDGSS